MKRKNTTGPIGVYLESYVVLDRKQWRWTRAVDNHGELVGYDDEQQALDGLTSANLVMSGRYVAVARPTHCPNCGGRDEVSISIPCPECKGRVEKEDACQAQRCVDEAARTWEDCPMTPALPYLWQDRKTAQPIRLVLCGPCARTLKLVREAR